MTTLINYVVSVLNAIGSIVTWLGSAFVNLVSYITHIIVHGLEYLVGWFCHFASPLVVYLINAIPDAIANIPWTTIAKSMYVANKWFPVTEALSYFLVFIGFIIVFTVVKVILYLF